MKRALIRCLSRREFISGEAVGELLQGQGVADAARDCRAENECKSSKSAGFSKTRLDSAGLGGTKRHRMMASSEILLDW